MSIKQNIQRRFDGFREFNSAFWIANTLELFERGAYYGMMAILSYHLVFNLGYSESVPGALMTMLLPLLYFIPLLSGALARKFGFKKTLIFSFILLAISYFALSAIEGPVALVLAMIGLGIGAGSFKPIISATIAIVTDEKKRNLGYSIYYWLINLGAFLMPLTIGFLFPSHLYSFVFIISGLMITINLLITIFKLKNVAEPDRDINIFQALNNILVVARDRKFVTLLLIYSGFWILFSQMHIYLPIYMPQFNIMPIWFTVPFLATINPGIIITMGPYLSKFSDKYDAMKVMIIGMFIFVAGWILTGIVPISFLFVTGIVIFSVGEFLTHPNFISYTSKIAPQDKVAIYMSCIFLSTGLGQLIGSFSSSFLYPTIAVGMGRPNFFWAIYISTAMMSIALLLIYNRHYSKKSGLKDDGSAPQGRKKKRTFFDSPHTSTGLILLIPVMLAVSWALGPMEIYDTDTSEPDWDWGQFTLEGETNIQEGYINENDIYTSEINIDRDHVLSINFTLTWTDEPDDNSGIGSRQNGGDQIGLTVTIPNGTEKSVGMIRNEHGEQGIIKMEITFNLSQNNNMGEGKGRYVFQIHGGDCGDQEPNRNILGLRTITDGGNDWELKIDHKYYEKK